ncbi:MAG: cation:dicarboxylase symporter family transporter [Bacteroidetes bacterium]|nr:cation:dicarboxylase symporter family transporter [Bacteroidota bacterium]
MIRIPKRHRLTLFILLAMVLGVAVGEWVHQTAGAKELKEFAGQIKLLTTIFMRLVQMIIAPLVFFTLVAGIAKMGDLRAVGRIGGKSMLWFVSASLVSLLLGMVLVNFFQPGVGVSLADIDSSSAKEVLDKTQHLGLAKFIEHVFPKSITEAMANNEVLQVVVFSLFFGIALTAFGEKGKPVVQLFDLVGHVILKMVGYIMQIAPLGVFGAMASVIALKGVGVLKVYLYYIGTFYVGLALLWIILLAVGYLILRQRLKTMLGRILNPLVIAFSTTSSEAVFPKLTEEMERFGCRPNIVSFVLPLGYSFNLDGSMMYMTFASIFLAQAYGVHLDFQTQLGMLFMLMLTSKGIAGVPRASLVVVTATCAVFMPTIPAEAIALILPVDHFCDMGRSMTNVLGNALATSAVSKWEGALEHVPHTKPE